MMKKNVIDVHNDKRVFLWDQNMENRKSFIDNLTGMFKTDFVEERKCPACQSERYQKIFIKGGGQYVKCKAFSTSGQ